MYYRLHSYTTCSHTIYNNEKLAYNYVVELIVIIKVVLNPFLIPASTEQWGETLLAEGNNISREGALV